MATRLEYLAFRLLVALFARLPFRVVYGLSDGLNFILRRLLRYRYRVIIDNLRRAFPDRTPEQLRRIARDYYRNLCDVTLEAIKGMRLPPEEIRRRCRLVNVDVLNAEQEHGRSVVVAGSHYANWEWGALAISLSARHTTVGIYKSLRNPLIEAYLNRLRGQWGLELRSMRQTSRALVEFRRRPAMYCLIADQTPSNARQAHWIRFLHQETPFLSGADKIARRTGFPVYYFDTRRVRRGFYEVAFSLLCDAPADAPEGEITRRYARRLEQIIEEEPANWLWSHRRWKKKRLEEREE
jgi:KDO2-lipid IV(A) lauroyltransferase